MSLPPGTSVGPYTIVGPLGAGGMGEVYRARDGKLQRDVAIKVLPAAVAADPDRLARFEREAQVLAALNHPHIAAIYGLQDTALVLELVEGPTLADRLAQGAMAVDEALPIARQIAEALEAAHEAGIVHRDLKPANIKLRGDGTAKVLDFGLAKAADSSGGRNFTSANSAAETAGLKSGPPYSPARGTEAGLILGTAAYMAPEQARGRAVDKRADIWAFGVVLWEMLTGRRLFEGETISDTLAAVLTQPPDLGALPSATPAAVRQLVARCLERDPKLRLRDIGEARVVLADPAASAAPADARPAVAPLPRAALLAAAVSGAVLVSGAWAFWPRSGPASPLTVFEIVPPAEVPLGLVNRPAVAVSQSGGTVVFVGRRVRISYLFVKRREDGAPHVIEGTDGASGPALSPDGRRIAFVANGRLRLVNVDGGAVTDVLPVNDSRGHAWRDNDRLIISTQPTSGLVEVAAVGGAVRNVTTLAPGERTHRWPHVLPGGTTAIFTVGSFGNPDDYDDSRIDAVDFATGTRKPLIARGRLAQAGPDGMLLMARLGVVSALPFDSGRVEVTGPPREVVQGVYGDKTTGASHFAYAPDGTLVYVPGDPLGHGRRVVWADRKGTVATAFDLPAETSLALADPVISPDGGRAAFVIRSGGNNDVWIHDFTRRTSTRFSFGGNNATPVWSADGRTLYYSNLDASGQKSTIFRKPVDGSREAERLATLDERIYLKQVDESRGLLLVDALRPVQLSDIARVSFAAGRPAEIEYLVSSTFDETGGSLSPDGRWLAYASDETGRYEIYVRDARAPAGGRWQVSNSVGEEPRWSRDGRQLYYWSESRFMVSQIGSASSFEASTPTVLFDAGFELRTDSAVTYSVDATGSRFLVLRPVEDRTAAQAVRVLLNWGSTLAR